MPHPLILDEGILQQYGPKLAVLISALHKIRIDAQEDMEMRNSDLDGLIWYPYAQKQTQHDRPSTKQIAKDGAVPISNQELVSLTGLSEFQLLNCKKLAEQEGLIKIDVRGIPGKLYYKVLKG
jgi:hypothetical protein